jgi:hypothetical protein
MVLDLKEGAVGVGSGVCSPSPGSRKILNLLQKIQVGEDSLLGDLLPDPEGKGIEKGIRGRRDIEPIYIKLRRTEVTGRERKGREASPANPNLLGEKAV